MKAAGLDRSSLWSEGSQFRLLAEFLVLDSGRLLLRLEYDPDRITEDEVTMIQAKVPRALTLISRGSTHGDRKRELSNVDVRNKGNRWSPVDSSMLFGRSLGDI